MAMKLIDNRYKVDKVLEDSLYGSIYKVTDFWDNDKELLMKLYNSEKQGNVISYFTENFITLSMIEHKFLLASGQFNIIKTIDRKKVNIKQYYSTMEYTEAPSLDEINMDLSLKDRLNIILQICTVLDFIHHRGLVYKYLSPSNIFLLEDMSIKIMDLATIYERTINKHYDDLTRYFIAPEVLLEHEDTVDINADKYSLGMMFIYLFAENFYSFDDSQIKYKDHFHLDDGQLKFLDNTIINLTRKNPATRNCSLRDIIQDINKIFHMNYRYDLVKERGILNFQTKIVGREREIDTILSIDENIFNNKYNNKLVLVKGDTGLGKTRFLKEINYILRMKGRDVYQTEIIENDNMALKPIENILRQTVKDTPSHIMSKYGRELARILPELKYMLDIESYPTIGEDRERLRLFDRITSYLEEFSKDKPIYLIIDDVDNCDLQFLFLLDFIFKSLNKGSIVLILAFNENKIPDNSIEEDIINRWNNQQEVEKIRITNLGLSEIGEFIQYILGISYKPLKFSAVMLKESQGNPRYIEYMMKDMYATEELYLSSEGYWEIKTQKYSDIYFPSSMDEVLNSQIHRMKREHREILEIISIYNSSISKNTLLSTLDMNRDEINNNLKELVTMRLLDERVADWGYSYSIINVQLKRLIYHQIPQEERMRLHSKVAKLLEDSYSSDLSPILDELAYHLMSSNQKGKALEYIVKEAERLGVYSSQSTILWEEAYEIAKGQDSEYKLIILENLGKVYSIRGQNDKALTIYKELFEYGQRLGKLEQSIAARIGIGDIHLKRNYTDLALKEAEATMELSKKHNCVDKLVQSSILYNKILLDSGKFDEVKSNMRELLETSLNNGLDKHLGNIFNLMGLSEYYIGNLDKAIINYEKSIECFKQTEDFIDSTKPMNNIANIYSQHGEISKAMEYYEEGLNIVERYGVLNAKLFFLNNIGSIYVMIHDYEKAKKYIEEARTTAIEVEDANVEFLTNINLGLIHLYIGDYEQSYNYYTVLNEKYSSNKGFSYEVTSYYYNFLGEFYYIFGKWDKALEYTNKSIRAYKDFNTVELLVSKARIILIRYFMDGIYDKDSIEELRSELKDRKLNYDRRDALINMAIIPYLEADYEFLLDILEEDIELKEKYSAPMLDYKNKILLYGMGYDEYSFENLIKVQENMKKHHLAHIDMYANILLGFKFSKDNKPYQAINYLLEALDLIYRLIKNIPDKDLQMSYIKKHMGDDIKRKIAETINRNLGVEVDCVYLDDIVLEKNIEGYFDYRSLISLIDEDDFRRITELSYPSDEIGDIANIETMMSKLTSDYEYNINIILKYLAKETLAQKGYILIYDEEKRKYLPTASLDDNLNWLPNENLLSLANRYERGILINNNLQPNIVGLYREFLPRDTRALICIPIMAIKGENTFLERERRQKQGFSSQRIEGYIYLETGRVFNRFDNKRYKLANSLSQVLYINIENYKLKILSTIDKLTGTYTRKYFESEFNRIFDEARRNDETFALLMLDIDRFKNINDTYGHRKGDEVLNKMGQCLMKGVRKTDVVARYGGEEFIVILRNVNRKEAVNIGEKIRTNIQSIRIPGVEDSITVSIGISQFPKHSQFKEELIEKADQALYSAKEKGRNRVKVWGTHLDNTLNRVDRLAGILSGNINQDQRNILALLDVIDLTKGNMKRDDKIFEFLGRLIETVEGEFATLIELDENNKQKNIYSRSRLNQEWVCQPIINQIIVERVIANRKGEFLIDWDSIYDTDLVLETPNWQSVIVLPIEFEGEIKGIVYISVPLREKEFDYNYYNMAKALCGIVSAMI